MLKIYKRNVPKGKNKYCLSQLKAFNNQRKASSKGAAKRKNEQMLNGVLIMVHCTCEWLLMGLVIILKSYTKHQRSIDKWLSIHISFQ